MTIEKPRNLLISDVTLNWARLDQPVSPFGTPQWELQIATTDKAKAEQMKADFLNVKEKDGEFTVSLKRKAIRADGNPMEIVRVVDADKAPITNRTSIGNGSKGNVIVWQSAYDQMGRKGVASSLTAVQITDLVVYTGGSSVDFDVVGDAAPAAELF